MHGLFTFMIAYESEHSERLRVEAAPAQAVGKQTLIARLWSARGFFGGVIAILLAVRGQMSLLDSPQNQNQDEAGRYYIAAIVVLLASFFYPALRLRKPKPLDTPADLTAVPAGVPLRSVRAARATTLPSDNTTARKAAISLVWFRWKALRARLGWRVTVGGLVLAALLAGVSTFVVSRDIGSVPGGWLWAAAILALVLTFAGAEGWPRGNGLLPGPRSDFFGRGVPMFSPRFEAILIGVILAVGLGLRLWNLEYHPGIYGDEGERGLNAWSTVQGQGGPLFGYGWWSVPNVYFYLVGLMLRIFGRTMVGDRMLSVISGMVCVWFIYKTGRLLWGPRVGLIAGALLAVSPFALQISRQASESAPTEALWVVGFYFVCMALRYRRPLDWTLAGTAWGLSLYFYASGKLIVGIAAVIILYCLVRWRGLFFKRYALGFALMLAAMVLTFLPNLTFNIRDNWVNFSLRSQQTAIFAAEVQPQVFARFHIPYENTWAYQPLFQTVTSHPREWAELLWNQTKLSVEVLYRIADSSEHYGITEHNGSLLSPLLSALALIGLVYGAWKIFDARFGILTIWFWGGMLGLILTMDVPKVERIVGAWPVLMIFPAVVLERAAAASWPLALSLARKWLTLPILALLIFMGIDSYREYFVHYASLCPFCRPTLTARYTQALGQDYKGYMLGTGDDVFFAYGSARYIAVGVDGEDMSAPVDRLPVTDNNGKGLAFMLYPASRDYVSILESLYPGGEKKDIIGVNSVNYFTSYKVSKQLLTSLRTTTATYSATAGGQRLQRDEPNLGAVPGWLPPPGLKYPSVASWQGQLYAPNYTTYTFNLSGVGGAELVIDGKTILVATPGSGATKTNVMLAKGLHAVRLNGTLVDSTSRVILTWSSPSMGLAPVSPTYLLRGSAGGLSAEVGSGSNPDALASDNPFTAGPVTKRMIYPTIGLRQAADVFGNNSPWTARFHGGLRVDTPGTYTFQALTNGPLVLKVDGSQIMGGTLQGSSRLSAAITLQAGEHTLDMRTCWGGGIAPIELYWWTPTGEHQFIPPSVLSPAEGATIEGN